MQNNLPFGEKYIEDRLSRIGTKVVKATELLFSARKLCENSNRLLLDVQTEIADLYESLGDIQ